MSLNHDKSEVIKFGYRNSEYICSIQGNPLENKDEETTVFTISSGLNPFLRTASLLSNTLVARSDLLREPLNARSGNHMISLKVIGKLSNGISIQF